MCKSNFNGLDRKEAIQKISSAARLYMNRHFVNNVIRSMNPHPVDGAIRDINPEEM